MPDSSTRASTGTTTEPQSPPTAHAGQDCFFSERSDRALARRRINVTVSEASGTLLDMSERGLAAMVRASVHYYNSEAELERFAAAVAELVR